jgi:hypothetical protein
VSAPIRSVAGLAFRIARPPSARAPYAFRSPGGRPFASAGGAFGYFDAFPAAALPLDWTVQSNLNGPMFDAAAISICSFARARRARRRVPIPVGFSCCENGLVTARFLLTELPMYAVFASVRIRRSTRHADADYYNYVQAGRTHDRAVRRSMSLPGTSATEKGREIGTPSLGCLEEAIRVIRSERVRCRTACCH